MRLNILNQIRIVSTKHQGSDAAPIRFGAIKQVSPSKFKFTPIGDPKGALLIERLDLGKFFGKFPQDITGLTNTPSEDFDKVMLAGKLGVQLVDELPFTNVGDEEVGEDDVLGRHFLTWIAFVGVRDLPRADVDLALDGDTLIIDARRATLYCGVVNVKVK